MGLLVLGVIAAIAFGTLYPFQLHCPGSLTAAFAQFRPAWPLSSGRGDIVANLLLYIPLGLGLVAWQHRRAVVLKLCLGMAIGFGLSLTLELLQTCARTRVAAWSDVCLNVLGTALGGFGAIVAGRRLQRAAPALGQADIGAMLLLGLFAAWRLAPYVPTIDWQKWKQALKPLLLWPAPPLAVLRHAILWLAVARLLETAWQPRRPALAVAMAIAAYFALKVLIVDGLVVPAELAGAGLALIVLLLIGRRLPILVLAMLLAGVIVIEAGQPWWFTALPRTFCWVPFCGFLQGSLLINAISMAEKLFLYGTLIWLLVRGGLGHRLAGIVVAVPLLALELVQTYLPSRVAEITDPLLALAIAETLRVIDRRPLTARQRR